MRVNRFNCFVVQEIGGRREAGQSDEIMIAGLKFFRHVVRLAVLVALGSRAAKAKRTKLPLDAHLMISNPLKYIDEFLDAGCDSVTFHVEVSPKQIAPTIDKIHAKGRAAGMSRTTSFSPPG